MLPASTLSDNQQITSQIIAFPAVLSQLSEETLLPCCASCDIATDSFYYSFDNKIQTFQKNPSFPQQTRHLPCEASLPSSCLSSSSKPDAHDCSWNRAPATHVQMHTLTWAPRLMSSACMNSGTSFKGKWRSPDSREEGAPRCAVALPWCERCLCVFIFALSSFCCLLPSRQPFAGEPPSRLPGSSVMCLAGVPPNVFHCSWWADHIKSLNRQH